MTGVTNLDAIGIANDLHRPVDPIGSVHHRVDDGFSEDPHRQDGVVGPLQLAFRKVEGRRQVISNRRNGPPNRRDQRSADLHRIKAVVRIFHPTPPRHAHVVDAHHRMAAPQRHRRAEQQEASSWKVGSRFDERCRTPWTS